VGAPAGAGRWALWICVGRHAADALAVGHLATVVGKLMIIFWFAQLIVGGPDGSLWASGHDCTGSKVHAGRAR
jgi:hypothetical protein